MFKRSGLLREWLLPIAATILLTLLFRTHIAEARYIPTGSMEPTLRIHDVVIIDKIHKEIERGDIVIFYTPKLYEGTKPLIKRAMGLPGDTLLIQDGKLFINGELMYEDYITEAPLQNYGPENIPVGEYFMMGDNRNNSYDSRYIGTIPAAQIQGKFVQCIPLSLVFDYVSSLMHQ